ncbi:LysR family transcriptional regulator [Inquilinus limosus]
MPSVHDGAIARPEAPPTTPRAGLPFRPIGVAGAGLVHLRSCRRVGMAAGSGCSEGGLGVQLRHLKTFAAVAARLNMTRAAEEVHLAQSSVTEQIQALEADLGTPLFDRSRRRLRLTEAGRRLLDYAGDLLALADEARSAVADAAGLAAGTLTIGGLETLATSRLAPLLATFGRAHPAIALQLKVAGSGELRRGVRSGEMDVCFAFGGVPEPELQSEPVAQERLVVIAPPGHRLAGRDTIGTGDLLGESFLVTEQGCVYRQMFESAFPAEAPGRPGVAGEFSSINTIRRLVEMGAGCALVPGLVAAEAGGSVVALPWVGDIDFVPVSMIWRRRRVQPPTLRLFLDAARDGFRLSDQPMPALDMQHRPGDEAVADQETDCIGDVGRPSNPSDRQLLGHGLERRGLGVAGDELPDR